MEIKDAEALLAALSPKERQRVLEHRVRQAAGKIPDFVFALAYVIAVPANVHSMTQVRSGTMLASTTRLIMLETDGGTITVGYGDVARITMIGGTKKLFGGYNRAALLITARNGDLDEWTIGESGAWGGLVAARIQQAHGEYVLSHGSEKGDGSEQL